jgi:hypothetical protein
MSDVGEKFPGSPAPAKIAELGALKFVFQRSVIV